jgi:hypothetical protein
MLEADPEFDQAQKKFLSNFKNNPVNKDGIINF